MKLIAFLILLNFIFLCGRLLGVEQYLFSGPTREVIEQNKQIMFKRDDLDKLKEYDSRVYNYYKLRKNEVERADNCGKETPEALREEINKNFTVYLNYEDFVLKQYNEIIKCNITNSRYSNIDIKVNYRDLLRSDFYSNNIFREYKEKNYKLNFLITLTSSQASNMANVMKILDPSILTSVSFYILEESDRNEYYLDRMLAFYLEYYPNITIYTGAKGINDRPYQSLYIDDLEGLSQISIRQDERKKVFLDIPYKEALELDIFSLEERIKDSNTQIAFPNSIYLGNNDNKINFLKALDSKYNIPELQKEYIKLKYEHYFFTNEIDV